MTDPMEVVWGAPQTVTGPEEVAQMTLPTSPLTMWLLVHSYILYAILAQAAECSHCPYSHDGYNLQPSGCHQVQKSSHWAEGSRCTWRQEQTQNNPVLEDCVCVPRSLGHIKDYNSGHVCLVLGEDCPQLAVGSSGHERNVRKKGSRNLQLTEKVYS